ncbi:hypothetical protein Pan189_03880 [Stratiformator vulcanicus]|uniref:Uncharacterized protein n=2 Tax=Stratiformator vulcanicus TaxID=2527980 RepID=A0A517QWS8_9PLAN|nr:hypothetical protein Pan189_03880 [Stratiformator vulcanicus]
MPQKKSFRIGRVRGDLRGRVWYLTYHEQGQRQRPRVGPSLDEARQTAAQINGQLESGQTALLTFDRIGIDELRCRWLDYHEHVRRSSLQTLRRYRTATQHLIDFLNRSPVRSVAELLAAADEWLFPIAATLAFTRMRPGEVVHLFVENFDRDEGLPHVRCRPELATPKTFRHLFAATQQQRRVDPLLCNLLMGHTPEDGGKHRTGPGMTAVHTHTRVETLWQELEHAFADSRLVTAMLQRHETTTRRKGVGSIPDATWSSATA